MNEQELNTYINNFICEQIEKRLNHYIKAATGIDWGSLYTKEVHKVQTLEEKLKEANNHILDLFTQGTYRDDKEKYDHMCMSTYESAQDYLVTEGFIKIEDCARL